MRIDERLNMMYDSFSENEKYVCRYLKGHFRECGRMSVEEFAKSCHVSKTLLVRFAKKLGLSGYSELKARIRLETRENEKTPAGLLEKVTDSYHKMMDDLWNRDLSGLMKKLRNARRVFVYGSGASQSRAASELKRIFLPAKEMIQLYGHDICYTIQSMAGPEDLVFIISLSGESESVVELAKGLKVKGVPSVSVTRMKNNTLASLCGDNLYIHSVQLPVGLHEKYETTTPYFILAEYLYLAYLDDLERLRNMSGRHI